MNLCPRDLKVCIDDVCRGPKVCIFTDLALLGRCSFCGGLISDDYSDCACGPDDDEDDIEDDEDDNLIALPPAAGRGTGPTP